MSRLAPFLCLLLLLSYAVIQTGCSSDAQSKDLELDEEESTVVIPVEVATVEVGSIAAFFTGTASLEAEGEATVVAKASGVVEQLFAEEGQYVEAGQVLAQLETDRSELELVRLEANLNRMKNDYERNKGLFDKQLISTETYDKVKFDYESEKAAYDLAQLTVEHASVRAPISGMVSERMIKVGNMVAQNSGTFRITDFNPLLAVLHVPEKELSKLNPGQAASLTVDALPGESFGGTILRISPVVDAATGTFKVTVEVRDRSRLLKPGMLARVHITYDERENVLLIPKGAVVVEDTESTVYVVKDSTAYKKAVRTGYTSPSSIEIIDGLEPGATVVTLGQGSLKDSSRVEIIQ